MTPLAELLTQRLRDEGSMPFSSFMAAALYHSGHGYYSSQNQRTGRKGDFFTSVSAGPVFGGLMAQEFCTAWERLGKPRQFTIIEAGANDGRFASDVLTWAATCRPDFLDSLVYQIDEPVVAAVSRQRDTLHSFAGRVRHGHIGPAPHGCYFANELLDALPCRRVRFTRGHWRELYVALDSDGRFTWQEELPEDAALTQRLAWLGTAFPEGYTTEIAPAVASQVRLAAERLTQGYLYFADYGYPADIYYAPSRTSGTLRCYRKHKAHDDPFDAIGETDLTAHVDFSLAASAAITAGCEVLGFLDQARLLTAIAAPIIREMDESSVPTGGSWQRQFQTLTHPAYLGQKFHFLVLGKGVPHLSRPDSLAFARPSAVANLLAVDFATVEEDG